MAYTCRRCGERFAREQRANGACPHCGTAFETAELIALCIGLACSFLLILVLPESLNALVHRAAWQAPSNTVVLLRACVAATVLAGVVLLLSAKYALWQGAALAAQPRLRLLWLVAFPGLLYAGIVLIVGVTFLSLTQRWPLRRSLVTFLRQP